MFSSHSMPSGKVNSVSTKGSDLLRWEVERSTLLGFLRIGLLNSSTFAVSIQPTGLPHFRIPGPPAPARPLVEGSGFDVTKRIVLPDGELR